MIRIRDIIYNQYISSEEKYEQLLYLMRKLDGNFVLEVDGRFVYIPNSIETSVSRSVINVSSNHTYHGDVLIDKITKNMEDEKVGIAIARRLNYMEDDVMKKVFYERVILRRDIRYIKKKYHLGSVSYYALLEKVKDVLIEYMCLNISGDTIQYVYNKIHCA